MTDKAVFKKLADFLNNEIRIANRDGHSIQFSEYSAKIMLEALKQLEAAQARIAELESKEFLPNNLDRACSVMGMALPESKEEFNFQAERWMQRLIDRVIRIGDDFQVAPSKPIVLPQPFTVRTGHPFNDCARPCMIPDDKGNWLSKLGVEHAIKISGGIVEG